MDKEASRASKSQSQKFRDAARELGCDGSEKHFDEALAKIAKQKPHDDLSKRKEKARRVRPGQFTLR